MINDLLSIMTNNDKEQFQRYLSARDKRKEGRSLSLFKALEKGNQEQLKTKIGTNAYNVLKMRLTESLSEFMAGKIFEGELTQEAHIIRILVLARKMLQLGKMETGRKLLIKAERKAQDIQHFTLLNEIYHSLIEISHESVFTKQETLIQKLEANSRNFLLQERLNLVYAQVKKAFMESEQGKKQIDLNELIKQNFEKYGITDRTGYGLKSLYQLATIIDYAAAQSRSYHSIDLFFANKIEMLSDEEIANERNHLYHIDLLYLLANAHFRKRSFERSMEYLERMHEQLQLFNRKFYNDRIVKHQLLMALNLNFSGKADSALNILNEVQVDSLKEESMDQLQLELTRIMILSQQEQYEEAFKRLKRYYRTDGYYKRIAGLEWVINKRFLEIILHIEAGNLDYAYTRIENFTRQHKEFFKDKANDQIQPFLRLLKHYLNKPDNIQTQEFRELVERTIPWKPSHEDDIFFISVYGWFKAKMTGKKVYPVTLELINSSSNDG